MSATVYGFLQCYTFLVLLRMVWDFSSQIFLPLLPQFGVYRLVNLAFPLEFLPSNRELLLAVSGGAMQLAHRLELVLQKTACKYHMSHMRGFMYSNRCLGFPSCISQVLCTQHSLIISFCRLASLAHTVAKQMGHLRLGNMHSWKTAHSCSQS